MQKSQTEYATFKLVQDIRQKDAVYIKFVLWELLWKCILWEEMITEIKLKN